ncbi:putative vacuolar amino acid transporter YPQ1 [Cocos nucifera]|uniref:Putative vacuolar amino acid transporter YPQ1 n=1 Tax=Cocos nucifera TaxID=13894 RepID=A0A8K0MV90_COCNU|nr:putative vacuolar amino acid transporter YPQ1 [Cocos nucifera]
MTWIIGDLFNLIGCLLEPATLPTQFYMALVLYMTTTVILTAQTVYYGHISHRLKANNDGICHKSHRHRLEDESTKERLLGYNKDDKEPRVSNYQANGSNPVGEGMHMTSSPIPVAAPVIGRYGSYVRDLYYMSARSLSKSPIPTAGSWLAHSRDSSRTLVNHDQHLSQEPLVGRFVPPRSAPPMNTKTMLSVVPSAAFFLGIYSVHFLMNMSFNASPHPAVILVGRKLLQDRVFESQVRHGDGSSGIGNLLGWAMAAIYMGGRLPQICLNVRFCYINGFIFNIKVFTPAENNK